MKYTKKLILWISKMVVANIVAVGILSLFVLFYQYSGIHIDNNSGATDYKWEAHQLKSNMVEGFSWFHMDGEGFINAFDSYEDVPDILLMGSSHMEAVQIKPTQTVAYLLNVLQPNFYTYNIGMSGHNIYRCVSNMSDAIKTYQPRKYVILETDTIKLNAMEMQSVVKGNDKKIPSYDSGIIYYLQKVPAMKWLYKALGDWISRDVATESLAMAEQLSEQNTQEASIEYREILNAFLWKAQSTAKEAGISLIIFYHPTESLTEDGTVDYNIDQSFLSVFRKACEENDIIFVDMTESFADLYRNDHVLGHGFENTAIGVGHLNQYGHQVIAEKLSEIVDKQEENQDVIG